jgi:putative transposase
MPWKTTCPKDQRWKFIQEFLQRKTPLSELCRGWGISRKTAYKWVARFHASGRLGLANRLPVARRISNRPSARWLARIRRWRWRHPHWGAPKLHWVLGRRFGRKGLPSESAISRWLRAWGLTRKRRRRAPKGPVVVRPALTLPQQPNEVWTVDFKGWFRTGDGTRVEPLTVRDLASRYVLAIALLSQQNVRDSRQVFERIFACYGLPRVIRADNGSPFGSSGALGLTRLSAWWVKLGIVVEFITPGRPDQNGAHEQLHRVYKAETLQPPARSLRRQARRSEQWRQQYNQDRPHEALGMMAPCELYRKSPRPMPTERTPWRYPAEWESRSVKSHGMIQFWGRGRFIGEAFEGERVGLQRTRAGVWAVYFGAHLIGELWDGETSGIRAVCYRRGRQSG